MAEGDILIVRENEVISLLDGRELELMEAVRAAYEAHARGQTSLPQSSFLTFPAERGSRIIALPAYLGGKYDSAGIKWVASFPTNLDLGLNRASAVVILNSLKTGRATAILEGSMISARRTAASAALAAQVLHRDRSVSQIGIIGCGVINFEIIRFLRSIYDGADSFVVFDLDANRARQFSRRCESAFAGVEVRVVTNIREVLAQCLLISFATTAVEPHVLDLSCCGAGSTILHISLRDISSEGILSADNVVDDVDHVCRARTSVQLADEVAGNRNFIRCTLPEILIGAAVPRADDESTCIFSPFGLGILDIAVSNLVYSRALAEQKGDVIKSFYATSDSTYRLKQSIVASPESIVFSPREI